VWLSVSWNASFTLYRRRGLITKLFHSKVRKREMSAGGPVFEKTCALTPRKRKKSLFWILIDCARPSSDFERKKTKLLTFLMF